MRRSAPRSNYLQLEYLWMRKLFELARGDYIDRGENVPFFYRAIVVAVDTEGGRLENPSGTGVVSFAVDGKSMSVAARSGPKNPKNSVKARIITNEMDQYLNDDELRVFWPMQQEHDMSPIKPGEHVYVTFEGDNFEHALWMGKVPGHENLNFYRGQDSFSSVDSGNQLKYVFGDLEKPSASPDDNDFVASGRLSKSSLKDLW